MTGRSHLLLTGAGYAALALHPLASPLGIVTAPGLLTHTDGLSVFVGSTAAAILGLLPDVDKSGSKAARLGGWPTRLLAWLVQLFVGHRGALHSLGALLAVRWVAGAVGGAIGLPALGDLAAFSWGMHLLLDGMTAGGIPVLWPAPLRLRLPPGIATGGVLEYLALLGLLALCGWWAGLDRLASLVGG